MPIRIVRHDLDDQTVRAVKTTLAAFGFPMAAVVDIRGTRLSRPQKTPRARARGDRDDREALHSIRLEPELMTAVAIFTTMPIGSFLTQFAMGMVKRAGEDAWSALKRFVTSILANGQKPPLHGIAIHDTVHVVQLELTDDLPPEAYERLQQLELEGLENARIHYDQTRGEWLATVPRKRAPRRGRR